jgi:hypothetical protein
MLPQGDAQRIMEYLVTIKSGLDVHIAESTILNANIAQLYKDFYIGNGHPPLKERVAKLEEGMPNREDWLEVHGWIQQEKKFAWLVVGAVITQVLILVFQLIKSLFLLPT